MPITTKRVREAEDGADALGGDERREGEEMFHYQQWGGGGRGGPGVGGYKHTQLDNKAERDAGSLPWISWGSQNLKGDDENCSTE